MDEPLSLMARLKRHHIFRVASAYAVTAYVLILVANAVFPDIGLSRADVRYIIGALALLFPVALVLGWMFIPPSQQNPDKFSHWQRLRFRLGSALTFVIVVLVTISGIYLWHANVRYMKDAAIAAAKASAVTTAPFAGTTIPASSVAVLPLANMSGDPKQQYFSDGLSEELITDLTQINGLKVIGKYSSFHFRDSKDSPAQIGAALGVAHLIQGSVFQQGKRIRVIVSLIRTKDGSNMWSHSYDEQLKDVFAIQSQIGQAVAAALKIKLMGRAIVSDDKPPSGNVEAYRLMLQGRDLNRRATETAIREGIALLQRAIQLDPGYAYAWGTLSNAWIILGSYFLTGDARQQAYTQARVTADKQQALAPDAAHTHMDRGYLLATVDGDAMGALAEYRRAYALAPNDGTAMNFLAGGLQTIGQLQAAVELYRKAIATDPLRTGFYANLGYVLLGQHQLDAAEQAFRKALVLQPDFPGLYSYLAQIDLLRSDAAAALRDAKQETDPAYGPWARTMAKQIGPDRKQADAALHDYIAKYGKDQPYLVADLYALRKQPDKMFEWLERAWKQHDQDLIANLLSDPFVLVYRHDPRFAALCKQAGLPLPGQSLPTAAP
ncbi:MAG: tetratricopeptide repeat protein [Gammaproteobacteria bacterium]